MAAAVTVAAAAAPAPAARQDVPIHLAEERCSNIQAELTPIHLDLGLARLAQGLHATTGGAYKAALGVPLQRVMQLEGRTPAKFTNCHE